MTFQRSFFIWLWPLATLGNVDTATRLVEEAVCRGAEFVALPELFNCLAESDVIS